jgi:restriction system protein
MKWQMNENSLFAVLLRSSWWISFAIAAALTALAVALLPEDYRYFGAVTGLPFVVIGCIAAWKQFQAPSTARVERTLAAVRAMPWVEFSRLLEAAYRRDGYDVTAIGGSAADFEIRKEWRTALVSSKRWKAARTGIEPLQDLHAAKEARNVQECVYVAAGDFTDNARAFAAKHRIRLVGGPELARLLPDAGRRK